MAQIHYKIVSCLQKLQRKDTIVYQFFEELLYGKQMSYYNINMMQMKKIAFYLNESHPQLLIALSLGSQPGPKRIFDIRKVQMRRQNYNYEMDYKLQRSKYLIITDQEEEIILIFAHRQDRDVFVLNIQGLSKAFHQIPNMYDPIIVKSFIKADFDQNQEISHEELKKTIHLMKMEIKSQQISRVIKNITRSSTSSAQIPSSSINLAHFQKLWKILFCRYELIKLFQKYSKNRLVTFEDYLLPLMSKQELQGFLFQEQKQSEDQVKNIINRLFINRQAISFYDFSRYIFSPQNQIGYRSIQLKNQKKQKSKQARDLKDNQPLNHYYCYSSHNTYLTGNQLTSTSRVQRYLIDLQNQFRCVQIDVHNGQNQPVVTHGYTFTSEVTFKEVVQAINMFSQQNKKHSPIILSLEVHCNVKNQKIMYDILTSSFGNRLVLIGNQSSRQKFPVLKQCWGKIIIKGPGNMEIFTKNQENINSHKNIQSKSLIENQPQIELNQQDDIELEERILLSHLAGGEFLNNLFQKTVQKQQNMPYYKNKLKFQDKIKQLTNSKINFLQKMRIFQEVKRKSFQKTSSQNGRQNINKLKLNPQFLSIISMLSKGRMDNMTPWQSISLNENKISQCFKNDKSKLIQLAKRKWIRSYPDGLRVNSSNYNPMHALQMGVQIIALNSQKEDCPFNLLLKIFFKKYSQKINGFYPTINVDQKQNIKTISVKFISAMRIYQNDFSDQKIPPVQIKSYFVGIQSDTRKNSQFIQKKSYTNIVQKNAFNPIFNQTQSETITLKYQHQQLAFLIVEIQGCGRGMIQLSQVKKGYRTIVLHDQFYKQKQSRILCHFETDSYRPQQQTLIQKLFF